MVIKFRWKVIEIRSKLDELQLILTNGHRHQKQIGQSNLLQTLFYSHSYNLSYRKNVQQNPTTSNHYLTLIPMFCQIEKGLSKIQSPPNTISHSPKNFKSNQAKSVRVCVREKRTG